MNQFTFRPDLCVSERGNLVWSLRKEGYTAWETYDRDTKTGTLHTDAGVLAVHLTYGNSNWQA